MRPPAAAAGEMLRPPSSIDRGWSQSASQIDCQPRRLARPTFAVGGTAPGCARARLMQKSGRHRPLNRPWHRSPAPPGRIARQRMVKPRKPTWRRCNDIVRHRSLGVDIGDVDDAAATGFRCGAAASARNGSARRLLLPISASESCIAMSPSASYVGGALFDRRPSRPKCSTVGASGASARPQAAPPATVGASWAVWRSVDQPARWPSGCDAR